MILCLEAIMGLVINLLQNIDGPHYWIGKWDLYRMNYLAMQLGSSYKTSAVWNVVVERTEKRLVQCQNFYLLKGILMILLEYIIYPSNLFSFFVYYSYASMKFSMGWERWGIQIPFGKLECSVLSHKNWWFGSEEPSVRLCCQISGYGGWERRAISFGDMSQGQNMGYYGVIGLPKWLEDPLGALVFGKA